MSPFISPPPLTAERVREVAARYPGLEKERRRLQRRGVLRTPAFRVPNLAAGETADDVLAESLGAALGGDAATVYRDYFRICSLLELLAQGTLDDAIERTRRALEHSDGHSIPFNLQVRLDQLRRIPAGDAHAVLHSLDVLEPELGLAVHDVRRRHFPGQAAEEANAAGALRTGDSRRPPLTPERVDLLLELLPRYAARSPRIRQMTWEHMKLDEQGAGARERLGARLSRAADEEAGGAEVFLRDVFWLMLIHSRSGRAGGIDGWLAEFQDASEPAAWLGTLPASSRRERNIVRAGSAAAGEMVRLLSLVSREEEAAIASRSDEIGRVLAGIRQGP